MTQYTESHPYTGQPAYGQPPYGYLAYGQPVYAQPVQVFAPARSTNPLAIAGLIVAFVFPPVGLVLALVARKQIEETGEEGQGLATAGIILGAIKTGLILLIVLMYVLFFAAIVSASG